MGFEGEKERLDASYGRFWRTFLEFDTEGAALRYGASLKD
jgi:hypothetical protein